MAAIRRKATLKQSIDLAENEVKLRMEIASTHIASGDYHYARTLLKKAIKLIDKIYAMKKELGSSVD